MELHELERHNLLLALERTGWKAKDVHCIDEQTGRVDEDDRQQKGSKGTRGR